MSTMEQESVSTVSAHIRDSLEALSASERKVARTILANYPIAALETVAELAKRANVSPPTVVRFASRLGFSGYPAFQKTLMREVHERLGSPLEQYDREDLGIDDNYLRRASSVFATSIHDTFREIPESEFATAVALLSDPRRAVRLVGGRFSHLLATYLAAHLQLLRPGVHIVPADEVGRLSAIADTNKSDVTVAFDYRRYDASTVRFAERVADRGSDIVLFTDRWLSPAADVANVVLPAHVEAPSPFDTMAPAMSLVEAIIAGVTDRLGDTGRKRLEGIESMRSRSHAAATTRV